MQKDGMCTPKNPPKLVILTQFFNRYECIGVSNCGKKYGFWDLWDCEWRDFEMKWNLSDRNGFWGQDFEPCMDFEQQDFESKGLAVTGFWYRARRVHIASEWWVNKWQDSFLAEFVKLWFSEKELKLSAVAAFEASCGPPIATLFENYSKSRIWIFWFWHFPPIFVLL